MLVEFPETPDFDYYDNYFGLKEDLENLFGRPTDITTLPSIENPYFRNRVLNTKEILYAA